VANGASADDFAGFLAAAGADWLAELSSLEVPPASAARGRQELCFNDQSAQKDGGENQLRKHHVVVHTAFIGRIARSI
jgi:hypothetical protein